MVRIGKRRSHKTLFGFLKINRVGVTGVTSVTSNLPLKRKIYWWEKKKRTR
jgi:hypothetical protein